jgi:hypothetical protein
MKSHRVVLGIAVFAVAAILIGQAAPNGCISPEQIFPQGDGSGLDADMVDGLNAADIVGCQKSFFSWYGTVGGSIFTVPAGKTLVITDVGAYDCACEPCGGSMAVEVDGTTKFRTNLNIEGIQQFRSGIPVEAGSEVRIYLEPCEMGDPDLFVGGYLIDAAP